MRAEHGERLGGQVFQPRTPVDQQGLAEDAAQPVPDAERILVAPLVQDPGGLPDRCFDRLVAEDQAGQVQPVEVAQVLEAREIAEQVAERDQERRDRSLSRERSGSEELLSAGAA